MGNILKDIAGVVSPAYGALTGEGMFGDLLGKKSEMADEAAATAKAAADAQAAEDKARADREQQAQNMAVLKSQGMKRGGKVKKMAAGGSTSESKSSGVKGWGIARGARKAKMY
jgi:membrane protein involved in colicin uptake